jgi:tRNA (mo5U34)-methyltransferase
LLNSQVKDKEIEIMDLSPTNVGKFDLVLCLGIMYHMEEPWTLIKVLKHLVNQGGELILETWTDGNYLAVPALIFYPNKQINNDDSTFFGPNVMCIEQMLIKEGFEVTDIKYLNSRVVFHAKKL